MILWCYEANQLNALVEATLRDRPSRRREKSKTLFRWLGLDTAAVVTELDEQPLFLADSTEVRSTSAERHVLSSTSSRLDS